MNYGLITARIKLQVNKIQYSHSKSKTLSFIFLLGGGGGGGGQDIGVYSYTPKSIKITQIKTRYHLSYTHIRES